VSRSICEGTASIDSPQKPGLRVSPRELR
jgi:hypothetical protein